MYKPNIRESKISTNWYIFSWSHDDSIVVSGWRCHCGRRSCWSSNKYSTSLAVPSLLAVSKAGNLYLFARPTDTLEWHSLANLWPVPNYEYYLTTLALTTCINK